MKINNLTISTIFSVVGLTLVAIAPAHSQSACPPSNNVLNSSDGCAEIYSATPDRVRLNLGQREVMVSTNPQTNLSTFTNFAPANNVLSKGPEGSNSFNVLTTSTYARADLQLSDGSLVWTKPYTQVALAQGNGCTPDNVYKSAPGQPPTNLCLRSGSILVIAPPNQARVAVVTDEGTIFTPGTIYLVSRNSQQKRTEVFVFSGAGPLRALPVKGTTACVAQGQPGAIPTADQECKIRIDAGQYVTMTSTEVSLPKPFDLPAWVATDPFFAPLTAKSNWQLSQNDENWAALLPSSAAQSLSASEPGLLDAMAINQGDCPLNVPPTFGGATSDLTFLPPPVLPAPPIRFVPPPPPMRPVRGMW